MKLFGLFGNKKDSYKQSGAPEIDDLPPIPAPDYGSDMSLDSSMDLPSFNSSELSDDSMALPDLPDDLSTDLSLDDSTTNSNVSSSTPDTSPTMQQALPDAVSLSNDSLPNQSKSQSQEVSSQSLEDSFLETEKSNPSLPVFEEVAVPMQADFESFSISELFIKREQYGQVLETLHNTRKELDVLIKKSALAKPNEKIGVMLKKAAAKHAELNKGLMFVEEHLVE